MLLQPSRASRCKKDGGGGAAALEANAPADGNLQSAYEEGAWAVAWTAQIMHMGRKALGTLSGNEGGI